MKKILYFVASLAVVGFVSCGGGEKAEGADSAVAVEENVEVVEGQVAPEVEDPAEIAGDALDDANAAAEAELGAAQEAAKAELEKAQSAAQAELEKAQKAAQEELNKALGR